MLFDNNITLTGNITYGPELKFTQGGMAVASFGIAQNDKKKDDTEQAHFFDVSVFRGLAENVAETLNKGDRVIVSGTLRYSEWQNDAGEKRSKHEIVADEVGPSLRWATGTISKVAKANGNAPSPDEAAAAAGMEDF